MTTTRTADARAWVFADPGIRFDIANWILVFWLLAASVTDLATDTVIYFTAVLGGVVCVGLPLYTTAAVGLTGWAFVTGFVLHDYGQLTLAHDDLNRLLAYVISAVVIAVLTDRAVRAIRVLGMDGVGADKGRLHG